ncbi:MAG: hypothetical protein OHK0015_49460 [Chloroflexi bacterium OHK40]
MPSARSLIALLIAPLLVGCQIEVRIDPATPTARPAAALPAAGYPSMPEGLEPARVINIIDGDTIDVAIGGREERVRLIGIDTPESVDPRRPVECFGVEASAAASALLDGQTVWLEEDPSQDSRDRHGRLLRYVWLEDGRMANLEQIAGGFAFEYTYDTPYRYREAFRLAERAARDAGIGLWSSNTCAGQSIPAGTTPAPTAAGQAPPATTPACPPTPDPASAAEAPVRIIALDKRAEVVRLENVGAAPVNLDGWLICSVRGGEPQAGLSGTLAPGEARDFANPGAPIWSNSNRDDAALYNPSGLLVSYWEDQ